MAPPEFRKLFGLSLKATSFEDFAEPRTHMTETRYVSQKHIMLRKMGPGKTVGKRLGDVKRMKEQSSVTCKCACAGAWTPWYIPLLGTFL